MSLPWLWLGFGGLWGLCCTAWLCAVQTPVDYSSDCSILRVPVPYCWFFPKSCFSSISQCWNYPPCREEKCDV